MAIASHVCGKDCYIIFELHIDPNLIGPELRRIYGREVKHNLRGKDSRWQIHDVPRKLTADEIEGMRKKKENIKQQQEGLQAWKWNAKEEGEVKGRGDGLNDENVLSGCVTN